MKKKIFKLKMNKETLCLLSSTETRAAAGGDEREASNPAFSKCETQCYTCHPECTIA